MIDVSITPRVRRARRMGFGAWVALVVLECLWHGAWQTPFSAPAFALAVVPLLLPLLALRRPMRALLWAGIIAVFYFGHGISDAWTTPATRVPGLVEAVLSVALITALALGLPRRRVVGTGDPGPDARPHRASRE